MSKVVHCRKFGYDVYIGRPSRWGNPFVIGKDGDREQVIELFELWITTSEDAKAVWIREHVKELQGKVLACWCAPKPCHGDVLSQLAEKEGRRR